MAAATRPAKARSRPNPFIGPHEYTEEDHALFFGRDREARELENLLIAQRFVLLHSPSGAGKTSLLRARVIRDLRDAGFLVPPILRVGRKSTGSAGNRYVESLLASLHPGEDATARADAGPEAAKVALADQIGEAIRRLFEVVPTPDDPGDPAPLPRPVKCALIFDQFEEVLTADAIDLDAKNAFFVALGRALRDAANVWALFVMRDDHVAALERYLPFLPKQLQVRVRLDLLGEKAAGDAIHGPIRSVGAGIDVEAVDHLVNELRQVRRQSAGAAAGSDEAEGSGGVVTVLGPYVEPYQLQVVSRRLWERWRDERPGARVISRRDVEEFAQIDRALEDYYTERVKEAAGNIAVEARTRDWIEEHLITPSGVRGLVLRNPGPMTSGLENAVIDRLATAFLVRIDRLRNEDWIELVHDRLIEPIRASNKRWAGEAIGALQRLYESALEGLAEEGGARPRSTRDWVARHFAPDGAAPGNARPPAVSEAEIDRHDRNLNLKAVCQRLADAGVLAIEVKNGVRFFRLSSRQMVVAVESSNTAWREAHPAAFDGKPFRRLWGHDHWRDLLERAAANPEPSRAFEELKKAASAVLHLFQDRGIPPEILKHESALRVYISDYSEADALGTIQSKIVKWVIQGMPERTIETCFADFDSEEKQDPFHPRIADRRRVLYSFPFYLTRERARDRFMTVIRYGEQTDVALIVPEDRAGILDEARGGPGLVPLIERVLGDNDLYFLCYNGFVFNSLIVDELNRLGRHVNGRDLRNKFRGLWPNLNKDRQLELYPSDLSIPESGRPIFLLDPAVLKGRDRVKELTSKGLSFLIKEHGLGPIPVGVGLTWWNLPYLLIEDRWSSLLDEIREILARSRAEFKAVGVRIDEPI